MSTLIRLAPLTGLAAVVLIIIGFIVGGEPAMVDDGIDEVAEFYVDDGDQQVAASILVAYGAAFLLAFFVMLRNVLRGSGDRSEPATVALVGGILFGVGLALFAGLGFALGDLAEDLDPVAIQALAALNEDLFMPLAVGNALLMWGVTFAVLRGGTSLPTWLGWVALVIAVISLTPIGWIGMMATGIWVAVVSILLTSRQGSAPPTPAAAPRPPAA
jgi:hypothetical protein